MNAEKKYKLIALLLPAAITIAIGFFWAYKMNLFSQRKPYEPVLFVVVNSESGTEIKRAEPDIFTGQSHLFIATHGWIEKTTWPQGLTIVINERVNSQMWFCGWFDWRSHSETINPVDTADYGKNTAGPMLAEQILSLSKDYEHIHLLGHSAGAWVINEAAEIIAQQTDAVIHLTFLDAYVPTFWNESELAEIAGDPNVSCWAEHYFTRDLTFGVTEKHLSNAVNVNITEITPGLTDHKFPWHWYLATVSGGYTTQQYIGKELYYSADGIDYGYPRSLEAGIQNWQFSLTLKPNKEPVIIKPADRQPLNE